MSDCVLCWITHLPVLVKIYYSCMFLHCLLSKVFWQARLEQGLLQPHLVCSPDYNQQS